jgi:hypothetical protein
MRMDSGRPGTAIDLRPCRYGGSTTTFRGPPIRPEGRYAVVLGGSDAFGRFVTRPFPERASAHAGMPVANLGVQSGGLDAFARDAALKPLIAGAAVVVVQVMAASNVSNRFYSVHPRRNDRFLRHAPILETLYPDIDFCDFAFTRHLLTGLRRASADKFAMVARELEEAWTARMRLLLTRIPGRAVLLRIEGVTDPDLGSEPLFVGERAMKAMAPLVDEVLTCDVSDTLGEDRLAGLRFPEAERVAAQAALPVAAHERIGALLGDALIGRGWAAA